MKKQGCEIGYREKGQWLGSDHGSQLEGQASTLEGHFLLWHGGPINNCCWLRANNIAVVFIRNKNSPVVLHDGPRYNFSRVIQNRRHSIPQTTWAASKIPSNLGEDLRLGLTLLPAVTFLACSFLICKIATRVSPKTLTGGSLTR